MKPGVLLPLLLATAIQLVASDTFGQPGNMVPLFQRQPGDAAEVQPPADHQALVEARNAYQAKVKAATDPLKAEYSQQLERLMKFYGGAGDLAAARAVNREIEKLNCSSQPATIVGKWKWDSLSREFRAGGVFVAAKGKFQGTWKCVDPKERKYEVVWLDENGQPNGFVDQLQLSADGSTLSGKNNKKHQFIGERADVNRPAANSNPAVAGTSIVGEWTWDGWGGGKRKFLENGVFIGGRGIIQGTWKVVDAKERTYEVVGMDEKGHRTGWTDSLQVSADGSTLSGKNSRGLPIEGKRVQDNSADDEVGAQPEP